MAWLVAHGFEMAERRRLAGVEDKGDISGVPGTVIEVKNCARLDLAGWMSELLEEVAHAGAWTGTVVHKKRGSASAGTWYATMPFFMYVELLQMAIKGYENG